MTKKTLNNSAHSPGQSKGIFDVFKHRFLLKLIVKKEVKVRYRASFLGLLWTYVKPAVSFTVYFFFVGYALGQKHIPDYAAYLYSGMILVSFFNETFRNATKSIRDNAALVRKIYLPRELFPIASWRVALVHFGPQLLIMSIIALYFHWTPSVKGILAIALAIIIITIFALGLGLLFAAANVFYKDSENFVELITSISTWFAPVLYQVKQIEVIAPGWLVQIYILNPLVGAVELMHYGFWTSLPDVKGSGSPMVEHTIPYLWQNAGLCFVIGALTLIIGQLVFRKCEGKFAQEL